MIQLTPHMRILVAIERVDFRKGIDSLVHLCRSEFDVDPFGGTVFVFCNRLKTSLKLLVYDGQGFWLCQKRLSKGSLLHWPDESSTMFPGAATLDAHALQVLLSNGNPSLVKSTPVWRPLRHAS